MTLWYKPLDGPKENRFSIFNDYSLLLLTYLLWGFTDFLDDPVFRYELGYVFIAIICINVAVHLIILIKGTFYTIKVKLLRRCIKNKFKKSPS